MNNLNFLNDKFIPANIPDICIQRNELYKNYQKASGKRLVFVQAPAGYGKSVSTSMWLNESDRNAIWITFDIYDNVTTIFYKLFCMGILSAQPENKSLLNILKEHSFMSTPMEHTITFLSEFLPDDNLYTLVLEDFHVITQEEILNSLIYVLRRLPNSFITIILTRKSLPDEYMEFVENGKAQLITTNQLAFNEEEIRKYFSAVGRTLTNNEAREALSITNGWPIGVSALAKSKQTEIAVEGANILEKYIRKQIWDKWDEELRNFMLKTSITNIITPELCKSLTGRSDSGILLDKLSNTSSFVISTPDNTYKYHQILLAFLRSEINESNIDQLSLYKKAAEYYMNRGEYFTASGFAIKSGNLSVIIKMIYEFTQYSKPTLKDYVNFSKIFNKDSLPENICDKYPFLYTLLAWADFLKGDAARTEYYIDKLSNFLPEIESNFSQFSEVGYVIISLDYRKKLTEIVDFLISKSSEFNSDAIIQGSYLTVQMPIMHRGSRDYSELSKDSLREAIISKTYGLLNKKSEALLFGIVSGIFFEKNQLKNALDYALQAKELSDASSVPELQFSSLVTIASIYYALGKNRLYDETIKEIEYFFEKSNANYLRPNFLAFRTKILLQDGNKTTAKAWLENDFITESEDLELYKIYQHFTTARAFMVLEQTDKAMNYILRLKKLAEDFDRNLDVCEAGILQSILEWTSGEKKEALDTLESVLIRLKPHEFTRLVADEGASILPILKKVISRLEKDGYHGGLNAVYLNELRIAVYEQSKRHKGIAENINSKIIKLSKQQKYMLTLLAKGYKNSQIAEITGLKIPTIKTHIYIAYDKLDVDNAMDAVIKARELQIIE